MRRHLSQHRVTSRAGNTLDSELRQVFMGERLGFSNRGPDKRAKVQPHTYRASLVLGVQPERAGALLDASGGTAQRVLWWSAVDPDTPEVTPEPPPMMAWRAPDTSGLDVDRYTGRRTVPVCETARAEIAEAAKGRHHRGGLTAAAADLDGHLLFTRLKVALGLAALQERLEVSEEDWRLAGLVITLCLATRAEVQAARAEAATDTGGR